MNRGGAEYAEELSDRLRVMHCFALCVAIGFPCGLGVFPIQSREAAPAQVECLPLASGSFYKDERQANRFNLQRQTGVVRDMLNPHKFIVGQAERLTGPEVRRHFADGV